MVGDAVLENGFVVIRGSKIVATGDGSINPPNGVKVIDTGGGTIMPGLIDAHVHLSAALVGTISWGAPVTGRLRPWVRQGITTVLDVGSVPGSLRSLRSSIEAEGSDAPRVVWAGPILTAPGGYPKPVFPSSFVGQEITTAEEGRTWVRRLSEEGAKLVKVAVERGFGGAHSWPLMSPEQIRAISEEAHRHGMLVTAHATSSDEVQLAIDGGVDHLAHTPTEHLEDSMMQLMVDKKMAITSTLAVFPGSAVTTNLKRFVDLGGVAAVGTDFGCCQQRPGVGSFISELDLMRAAGLSPLQALRAATRGGAEVSNLGEEAGTLEPGRIADILVVRGDPLADPHALEKLDLVLKAGEVVLAR